MMQIFVVTTSGKSVILQLQEPSYRCFMDQVKRKMPTENMRFVIKAKQFSPEGDEEKFKEFVRLGIIHEGANVHVLGRLLGGGLQHEVQNLVDVMLKFPKQKGECTICYDEEPCYQFCCAKECETCLKSHVESDVGEPKCAICSEKYGKKTPPKARANLMRHLKREVSNVQERKELTTHLNVTHCQCEALVISDDSKAWKVCPSCRRDFCFFCNEDWSANRKNRNYSCGDDCTFLKAFNPERIEFHGGQIPAHRFCPQCWRRGAFDEKCRMHECLCGCNFCFFCLKSQDDCLKTTNGRYYTPCSVYTKQTPDQMPWL